MCLFNNFNNPNPFAWGRLFFCPTEGYLPTVAQIGRLAQNYTMEYCQSKKLKEIKLWSHALGDLLDLDYCAAKGLISVRMESQSKKTT